MRTPLCLTPGTLSENCLYLNVYAPVTDVSMLVCNISIACWELDAPFSNLNLLTAVFMVFMTTKVKPETIACERLCNTINTHGVVLIKASGNGFSVEHDYLTLPWNMRKHVEDSLQPSNVAHTIYLQSNTQSTPCQLFST